MLNNLLLALPLLGAVNAFPTNIKREVPQEHAHRNVNIIVAKLVNLNNPDNLGDAVFGLLGAKAAAAGIGNTQDPDCLQQNIADRAFTNAKAAGDIEGQTFALIYRALERNTGSVGLASVPCTTVQAVNPEIAALQQHQDPAGQGAQALNKQIAIELAKQIASIGGDVSLANEASTFAPGQLGDPTAKGNTCDDANDDLGCINTQKLRVDDLTAQEIQDAVSGIASGGAANNNGAQACAAAPAAGNNNNNNNNNNAAAGNNNNNAQGGAVSASAFNGCDVSIVFTATPSDGRQSSAFEANDLATFPHGSALNIGVISDFNCQQAVNKCNLDAATAAACNAASVAAKALKGQAAADAFNSALGF